MTMLPYPIDQPGYLTFPGTPGNYLSAPDNDAFDITGDITIVARIRPKVQPTNYGSIISKWSGGAAYYLMLSNTGCLRLGVYDVSEKAADSIPLTDYVGEWIDVAATLDIDNGAAGRTWRYWTSADGGTTWTILGDPVTQAGAITAIASTSGALFIGVLSGTSWPYLGDIAYLSLRSGIGASGAVGGTEVFRFDGSQDLAGVPPDAATFKSSVIPTGSLLTVNRKAKAVSQGYVTLDGNPGNYLSTADIGALDIASDIAVQARVRPIDTSPLTVGIALVSKSVTAGQYSFNITFTTTGTLLLQWSVDGTAVVSLESTALPVGGQWIWLSVQLDTTAKKMYAWYSLADTLTPSETNADWTSIGTATVAATATVFLGSSPLYVGALTPTGLTFEGDIGYLAYGTGVSVTDPTALTTTAFRIDADSWVGVTPDAESFLASIGGTVTINHSSSPKDTGFIELPGTKNNCLSIPDSVPLDLSGAFTIGARINPKFPLPNYIPEQTIISKWGVAGKRSYALQIDTEGKVVLQYSNDGTASVVLRSSHPLTFDGNPQWIIASTWIATTRRVRFWRSSDRIMWTEVGTEQAHATTTIFNSTSPLIIGASFQGRISGAIINTGGGTTGVPNGTTEVLRLGSDHLVLGDEIPAVPNAYLTPTVGTVTTPDPGPLPAECVFVFKMRQDLPYVGAHEPAIVSQDMNYEGGRSWIICRTPFAQDRWVWYQWPDATGSGYTSTNAAVTAAPPTGLDETWAVSVDQNDAGVRRMRSFRPDGMGGWTPLDAGNTTSLLNLYDASSVVRIGSSFDASGGNAWRGRIYSVELRTGLDPSAGGEALAIPGYVTFPGTNGNHLSTPDAAALDITGDFEIVVRASANIYNTGIQHGLCGKGGSYAFGFNSSGPSLVAVFYFTDAPSTPIFAGPPPFAFANGTTYWFKMTRVASTGLTSFFYAADSPTEPTSWTANGTATVAAGKTLVNSTQSFFIGAIAVSTWPFAGRIHYVSVRSTGIEVFRFDGTDLSPTILPTATSFIAGTGQTITVNRSAGDPKTTIVPTTAGVIWRFDADDYPGTGTSYIDSRGRTWTLMAAAAITPKVPIGTTSFPIVGGTATAYRTPTPVNFGYIDIPGTTGNYLTVPDNVNLRLGNNFCVTTRITPDDVTPSNTDRILVRKWGASGQFGWQLLFSTTGTLKFVWSTNGTTSTTTESLVLPLQAHYSLRVAFTYSTTLGGQFWTSDDNVKWTKLGGTTTLSATAHLSTAQVEIGHTFPGAISEVSIRNSLNTDGSPKLATEVLLIDQSCLGVDPAAPFFVATTGQTVTVWRDDYSIVHGNVRFTGTLGNYLSTPDHVSLDIAGNIGFLFRIAPDTWKPHTPQTFISKWDDGNPANASYLVRLSPTGTFLFSYTSLDGNTDVTMESPAVEDVADGEFRFLALTVEFAATKTMRLWETTDYGDTWLPVGAPVTETAGDATRPVGTSELIIGAQNLDVGHFAGRISYLDIRNGVGTGGTVGTSPSAFLMDAEALHILVTDNEFTERTGKVVTLHQANTPVLPGYLTFGGVTTEFMRVDVPTFDTTGNFTIISRISLAIPEGEEEGEQVVIQKWNEKELVAVSNKALTSNVATITTSTAHKLVANDKVEVARVGAPFDGTYTVVSVPTTTTFTYAKINANIASAAATGDAIPLGRSFSLRREGDNFIFLVSVDGKSDTIHALSPDWPVDPVEATDSKWGWLAVTGMFQQEQPDENLAAVVRWYYAEDKLTPAGTPIFPETWTVWGAQQAFNTDQLMHITAGEQITIGGTELGTLPLLGSISDLLLCEGVETGGLPGGEAQFFFNLEDFFALTSDSGAFLASTGQNVVLEPLATARTMHIEPTPTGPALFVTPAPPGPTTQILPAPPGPTLVIQPASPGLVAEVTASRPGPSIELVGPSLDRPWWPQGDDPDPSKWWTQPAFVVQRTVTGGDYVRGSTNVFTEQTAIRFPTRLAGWTEAGVGKGLLFARPDWLHDPYGTIEVEWNFPQEMVDKPDLWSEVVIVRSAMGNPLSVNDGQTIYRVTRQMLFPGLSEIPPSYPVGNDGNVLTPNIFDPHPYDPTGGQPGLPNGRWYYYGLFFLIGKDWVRSATNYTLLPRNFGHSEHLWNAVPPYYRWLDYEQGRQGDLRNYLKIFGYELDYTRELVESWQDLYHTDFTPMSLLKRIGDNFGVPYEPGIGDYCYRGLVSRVGYLYRGRGTTGALRQMIAATGKCDCDVTQSENVLLLPDDADFYTGTGNWAGLHPQTVISGAGIPTAPLTPDKIFVEHGTYNRPAPEIGRGSLHVWTSLADATANLIIACGDGLLYFFDNHGTTDPHDYTWLSTTTAPPKEFFPRFTSSPVIEGEVYGFSISVRCDVAGVTVMPMILYFPLTGMPDDVIPAVELPATPTVLAANTWAKVFVSGPVPDGAQYLVPAVGLTTRPAGSDATLSPMIHFDAAAVYLLGTTLEISSTDVDRYLTLGVTREKLGVATESPPYPGYLLGDQLT